MIDIKSQFDNTAFVPRRLVVSSLLFLLVGFLSACDKTAPLEKLTAIELTSRITHSVEVNFCTPPQEEQKQYLKTIVILDHSGSNQRNYRMVTGGSGEPATPITIDEAYATDPDGKTRYGTTTTEGTLLNYLSTLEPNDPADPTRFFASIDFSTDASSYPGSSFTSNTQDFFNHMQGQAGGPDAGSPNDNGSTSYLSALTRAYNIINNDIVSAKNCAARNPASAPSGNCYKPGVAIASSYVIVFMSDGSPIIQIDDLGGGELKITRESTTEILGKVGSLMALLANDKFVAGMNIFTIYYYKPGNVDQNSQTLLSQMARAGSGLAYNAHSGSNIDYKQFQPPKKMLTYSLNDIFVTNANGVWWSDKKYHLDTDSDGLPDFVETEWGTNPDRASTDNNGVSDLVKYTLIHGKSCTKNALGYCPIQSISTAACSGTGSSDPNGMNDCEKTLLQNVAGIGNPDSNYDNIPDWLEFINGIPFQKGTTPAVTQILQDGYTSYQKVKYSLPVGIPVTMLPNMIPAKYKLSLVSTENSINCYRLNVSDFPRISEISEDKVRVDIIIKSNLLKDSYKYRKGLKPFSASSTHLKINDWNDTADGSNWSLWP